MKRTLNIIALRTIRHSERHDILTAYSREAGRVAFAITAGSGREASRRRALLMPLGLLECVADMKPGREIHTMRDPRALRPLHGLRMHPVKSAVAMFIAEVLAVILREGPADEGMFDYVARSVVALDVMEGAGVANFHICFMVGLSRVLGIEPDTADYQEGMVFDMAGGHFRLTPPLHSHYLDAARSRMVVELLRMNLTNLHLYKMNRMQRNEMLDTILEYFSLHYTALSSLRSLDVVRDLF